MLSLCMIVKNEENNLKKCLPLIPSCVDEIIIVDTGSTDNSKIIALEYTDKVYDFKWCNDFSSARNYSISKAVNDWILVLDADEYIIDFSSYELNKLISDESNENKIGRIQRINIVEGNLIKKKSLERINRLFNRNNFYYTGIIHEQLVSKKNHEFQSINVNIKVEHIGYTKEEINKTNKLDRNIELLNKAIRENGEEAYLEYQLGKAWYLKKEYIQASINFEKALNYSLDYKLEYVADLIETYGYSLINEQKYEETLRFEKYLKYYNNADFYFLLGLIYMNNAKFIPSLESFSKCTKFSKGKVEGITTYMPYYNMGVIFEILGHKEEALGYYKKCGNYELAVKRLKAQLN